jgi:hypothetical protein
MTTITMPSSLTLVPSLETAWQSVDGSFERFCLTAGIGAISISPNQLKTTLTPHRIFHGDACFAYFNKIWGNPACLVKLGFRRNRIERRREV